MNISAIFKVKGSDPERFCIAYTDPALSKDKGYTMSTKFATEQELRDVLKDWKSEAEIDSLIQEARKDER